MIYRDATLADISPQGVELCMLALRETALGTMDPDPASIAVTASRMVADPGHLVAVAEDPENGALAGLLVAHHALPIFSRATMTTMQVWYVRPEYRGTRTAFRLLQVYRRWSQVVGAKTAFLEVNSAVADERATRLARHAGFEAFGVVLRARNE